MLRLQERQRTQQTDKPETEVREPKTGQTTHQRGSRCARQEAREKICGGGERAGEERYLGMPQNTSRIMPIRVSVRPSPTR
jgi:hypothetical protein